MKPKSPTRFYRLRSDGVSYATLNEAITGLDVDALDGIVIVEGHALRPHRPPVQIQWLPLDEPPPAPKPARAYKPRKANLDAVSAELFSDSPRTVEAIVKSSGCGKPLVAAVLGYLKAQALAVETPDGWRAMPGAKS